MSKDRAKERYYEPIPKIDDQLVGKQFGNWKVLRYVETRPGRRRMFECLCLGCHKTTKLFDKGYFIKAPMNKSCGCQSNPLKNKRRTQSSFNEFIEENDYVRVFDANKNSFIVDKECVELLKERYWAINKRNEVVSKSNVIGNIKLHRFLMNIENSKLVVDHINGDKKDNRLCNLRVVTTMQNSWNINPNSNNSSGRRGVYWNKSSKKWEVDIKCNGIKHRLGKYKDLNEAIKVREDAEIKYYGEYRRKQ